VPLTNSDATNGVTIYVTRLGASPTDAAATGPMIVKPGLSRDLPVLGTCSVWVAAAVGTNWSAAVHDVVVAG
jgi:hypothetical protein